MPSSYQLTKHPLGSIREMWSISWPLMLSYLSISLMMFVDRLLVSLYSSQALNAMTHASNLCFIALVPLFVTTSISEVLVGRFHGAGTFKSIGMPVWQMIWFSLMTLPLFLGFLYFVLPFLLQSGENPEVEMSYASIVMWLGPFFCSTTALMGFFIGTGRVKIVTLTTILGNLVNFALGVLLIFGWGFIPAYGVKGAAFAWCLSQILQTIFLLVLFLTSKNRKECGTLNWKFNYDCFKESLNIALPPGIHIFFEASVIAAFMHLLFLSGKENFLIAAVAQSFWFLLNFLIEGLGKGITAISANMIGGNQLDKLSRTLKSAMSIHTLFFIGLALLLLGYPDTILPLFFNVEDRHLLHKASFLAEMNQTWIWLTIFFLFDGFARVLSGQLISAGDSKYIFYAGLFTNYVIFLLPVSYLLYFGYIGVAGAWFFSPVAALCSCFLLYRRLKSNVWQHEISPIVT